MKIDVKKILGGNIKKLRNLKKLSQTEFAEKISLQTQAISQIETGKAYPLPETLSKICEKFNVSPAFLFSSTEFLTKEELSSREELLNAIDIILSETDNDKLEILVNIMAMIAEENIKIKIEK